MKRKEYNKSILNRCTELLQSHDSYEICEGVVLSAYLIEQSFKSELKKINPLLYFDRRNISCEIEAQIALKKLSEEDVNRLKTSSAKRCILQMCEYKNELQSHKANLEELFDIRNFIIHSIEDLPFTDEAVAETAVSALRICKKYVIRYSGIISGEFNPLTSREFETLQGKKWNKRIDEIKKRLKEHKSVFEKLDEKEIENRIITNKPETDDYTWIEETTECPACNQSSFDKVGIVDFDWNPDGIITSGGYHYQCRVCELELTEYEYEIVGTF